MESTITPEAILNAVYEAVDRLNETLPSDKRVAKSPETRLIGAEGILDSLGAVNLIVETETALDEKLGLQVNLADERAASQSVHPLQSISTFVSYIHSLVG